MKKIFLTFLFLSIFSSASSEEKYHFGLFFGLGEDDGEDAINFSTPFSKKYQKLEIHLNPFDGNLITTESKNGRYQAQTLSNGNEVCRDTETGRFVKKENCINTEFKYGATIGVDYLYGQSLNGLVGIGYRLGNPSLPYFNVGIKLDSEQMILKSTVSKKYFLLSFGGYFGRK